MAYQRSGTHFLGSCLNSHPNLTYIGEAFGLSGNRQHPGERFATSIGCPLAKKDWEKLVICLEKIYAEFSHKSMCTIVLDVKYNQITPALAKLLERIKVIRLIRRDFRARYFSELYWEIFKKNPLQWALAKETLQIPINRKTFDENACRDAMKVRVFQNKLGYLADLDLYYEDLTNNEQANELPRAAVEMICNFLEIKYHRLTTSMSKIAPCTIDDFLQKNK